MQTLTTHDQCPQHGTFYTSDMLTVASTCVIIFIYLIVQRLLVLPALLRQHHGQFSTGDRFEWGRRAVNITAQAILAPANMYILLFDRRVQADYLYGYSSFAHHTFVVTIVVYLIDTLLYIVHPVRQCLTEVWVFHHTVTITLLTWDVAFRRVSAFPAATFLMAAASHVAADLRWFLIAMRVRSVVINNFVNVICVLVVVLSCVLPPPYMLFKIARQKSSTLTQLVIAHMQPYCIFFFLLIYIPHLMLPYFQMRRLVNNWGRPPKPFKSLEGEQCEHQH